ncbi:MAG TPA: DUF4331 domain-containing protein [Methylocella sp.]|nr:DUF4331 domain-containing protein [Methylocella sp.]
MKRVTELAVPICASLALLWGGPAKAASHREAPLISFDPSADNTDVYAFVSYDEANIARSPANRRVTFIMNVNPGQDPSDGPNYFNFNDTVLYRFHIDNDEDGKADNIVYEFRFKTENRPIGGPGGLTSPVPYLGNKHIPSSVPLQGITALNGPGSEGLTRRQTYTVTEVRNGVPTELFSGRTLIAVPSNAGPATMPKYPALAAQGIYTDSASGIRVFAGQRAETFYIDLGAVFDTLNLRRYPPLLSVSEDAGDVNPFGINRFSGSNVSTIAIEVPIKRITSDGKPALTTKNPFIGMYASTSRNGVRLSRLANPLVNELIITTPFKDKWNASAPQNEAVFQSFYKNPVIATALKLVYNVDVLPIDGSPANNRTDLMSILLKYPGQPLSGSNCGTPCAELLRLDLRVPPVRPEDQNRLGAALSSDKAGWPNGRRPNDDVTDIALRVVGGKNYIAARAGDGVNSLAGAPGAGGPVVTANGIAKTFPFLPNPYDGKNRRHVDCGETGPGANPCGPLVP